MLYHLCLQYFTSSLPPHIEIYIKTQSALNEFPQHHHYWSQPMCIDEEEAARGGEDGSQPKKIIKWANYNLHFI